MTPHSQALELLRKTREEVPSAGYGQEIRFEGHGVYAIDIDSYDAFVAAVDAFLSAQKDNAAPQASPSVAPADSEFGSAVGPAAAAPSIALPVKRKDVRVLDSDDRVVAVCECQSDAEQIVAALNATPNGKERG